MKKVIVFGTFDIIHPGHIHMLKEAKEYGDFLIVVIARDDIACRIKNKRLRHNEEERFEAIKNLDIANKIRLGCLDDQYKVIKEENPDIIALGYDQKAFVDKLEEVIKDEAKIVRLSAYKPEVYKSSKIQDLYD